MEQDHNQELQLLTTPNTAPSPPHPEAWPPKKLRATDHFEGPSSLDLQLSISLTPLKPTPPTYGLMSKFKDYTKEKLDSRCVESLKWQAAEQIRLAAMEKAYAERIRELTRKEMEMAQNEFACARSMWERAREEVEKVERMKERATRRIDSTCMEITCQSCRQKFRP